MFMSYAVHRLHTASVNYLDGRIDVYAYVVITDNDVLLIDTGVGEGNDFIERRFEPQRTPLVESLAAFGLKTTDINLLINSHLHFDHCGNNQLFSNAEIFVQAEELKIARTPLYTVREWFDYSDAQLTAVDGELDIRPGIKLLPTPGHTPGHQSILVDTADGSILVAAQAAYTVEEYQQGGDPAEQAHKGLEAEYCTSIAALKSLAASRVCFSHDNRDG